MNTTNALRKSEHVDINYGLDYERARERLNDYAGRAWRLYLAAKQMQKSEDEIASLREAYVAAQHKFKNLKRTDVAEIAAILGSDRA